MLTPLPWYGYQYGCTDYYILHLCALYNLLLHNMSSKTLHHAGSLPENFIAREEESKNDNPGALRKCQGITNKTLFARTQ